MRTASLLLSLALTAGPAFAQLNNRAYEQRRGVPTETGEQIDLKDLSDIRDCSVIGPPILGRVVKRDFDRTGLTVTSLVVEQESGDRTLFNLIPELDDLSLTERGQTISALQRVTRAGAMVLVDYAACGAAGRVLMANRIRSH